MGRGVNVGMSVIVARGVNVREGVTEAVNIGVGCGVLVAVGVNVREGVTEAV